MSRLPMFLLLALAAIPPLYSMCDNADGFHCLSNGTLTVKYHGSGENVQFHITAVNVSLPAYVAIGFNMEPKMTNASIVACLQSSTSGNGTMGLYKATAQTKPDSYKFDGGVSMSSSKVNGNTLECSFTRPLKKPEGAPDGFADISQGQSDCVVMATGKVKSGGELAKHTETQTFHCDINFLETASTTPKSSANLPEKSVFVLTGLAMVVMLRY